MTSYGLLGIGGAILFAVGGILLVDPASSSEPYYIEPGFSVDLAVIIPMVLTLAALFAYLGYYVIRSQRRKIATGAEAMEGAQGEARSEVTSKGGRVFVHGEIWLATSEQVIPAGAKIVVTRLDGLKVQVKQVS